MHSNQNKFPFHSNDWHLVPPISPLRIDPWENHVHIDVLLCWIQQRVSDRCNHDPSQLLAGDGAT